MKLYSYLALGDSYTIGEQVKLSGSFPYQAVQLLRQHGLNFSAPEIVAATGWTTGELQVAIEHSKLLPSYNFVSLLIGVNNQYRGGSVEEFRLQYKYLLELAIQLADDIAQHVIVLSIPDWGITPYAADRDQQKISSEIDLYNFMCKTEAEYFQVRYIDITESQRRDGRSADFLAPDQLHPSAKEYFKWAEKICGHITSMIEKNM